VRRAGKGLTVSLCVRWWECGIATYVSLYAGFRPSYGLVTADVAVVEFGVEQGFTFTFWWLDVEQSNTDAFHAEHLRHDSTQASRATSDDYYFLVPVHLARWSPCQAFVKDLHKGEDRDYGCVKACVADVRVMQGIGQRA